MFDRHHYSARCAVAALASVVLSLLAAPLRATDYGAASASGTWSVSSAWTPSGVPGASDNVYIGSNYPSGAATTATVTLTQSQSASNLYLGYAGGDSGTLNLGNFNLAVGNSLYMGYNLGSSGSIVRGSGSFTTQNLNVYNRNSLALGAGDAATSLTLADSALLTTAATGNITSYVTVETGSKLTLGANMPLSGNFSLQDSGSTLNMGGHTLSAASSIYLGWYGNGVPTLANRGPLSTPNLYVADQPFSLAPADTVTHFTLSNVSGSTLGSNSVSSLTLADSSLLTTTTTGNVTSYVTVESGSKLTLGANMALSGNFSLQDSGSTLNMGGHALSAASNIYLGWYGNGVPALVNRGPLSTPNLYVADQPFSLASADTVTNFTLSNVSGSTLGSNSVSSLTLADSSLLTTTTTGNVTTNVTVESGSKLTLAANMSLSNNFSLQDSGSTLDMGGHALSAASNIYLGWYGSGAPTLVNRGPLSTPNLYVAYQPFSLAPADTVANFTLYDVRGSTLGSNSVAALTLEASSLLTTTTTGNVTTNVTVESGSKLTLGANMSLSNNFSLQDSGSTLDMGGHSLSAASNIYLGWYGSGAPTLVNRGPLSTPNLYVAYQPFSLAPADTVTNFTLYDVRGSTLGSNSVSALTLEASSLLTTTASGNVTSQATVESGSKLTLGANMVLSNDFNLQDNGSTLDMGGHKLSSASQITLGWYGSSPVSIANPGPVSTSYLYVGNGSKVPLSAPASIVNSQITISNNSQLNLQQPSGQLTGMTFLGSASGQLSINDTSLLQLSGGSNSGPSWLFRWKDPAAGTWVNTLNGSIAAGRIAVSSTSGYSVFDDEGYSYVATPSTLIWNGGASLDTSWSNAANWGGATPTAGHWLRFGALAAGGHAANTNNLPANSLFYGIFFDTAAPSYNLQGNAIQLSGDVLNQSGTNQTISLNIQLVPGDGAFDQGIFDTGGMKITDSGNISGSGMELIKTGTGTLVLSGSNTYSGGTEVLAGKLIVTSSNSLLTGSSLIVGSNAAALFSKLSVDPIVTAESSPVSVPEPGPLALLSAASAAAVILARKIGRRMKPAPRGKCGSGRA